MTPIKKALILFQLATFTLSAQSYIQVNKVTIGNDYYLQKHLSPLENIYKSNQNQPLWLINQKIKGKKVMQLLALIQKDVTLNPRSSIQKIAKEVKIDLTQKHTPNSMVKLELKLTSLYYDFLQHTIYGEINWKKFDNFIAQEKENGINHHWVRYPLYFDVIKLISNENIQQTIKQITPQNYHYQSLRSSLYKLYKIKWQGGWRKLPIFHSLKKGDSSSVVPQIRKRLILSGDYKNCLAKASSRYFDGCLQKAVKNFQKRHNVLADGVVGRGTQRLMNVSVESKINKVLLNIDRIKWLPRNIMERHIIVNIPEYMLHYYENNIEQKQLKVIVGNVKHPTPIFSDTLSYLTLNPYWKLPANIIRKEVVPEMIKNPNYMRQHRLEAHETWEENSSIVSLKGFNWSQYLDKESKFPYRIMQPPGDRNALGRIKFKFPNKFSVYLHDTPTKSLFKKRKRAFSHGCIRLSNPFSLLESLAEMEPTINKEMVNNILRSKKKKEVDLTRDLPIHLIYLTTWTNNKGELIFGDDIYKYDKYQERVVR